MPTPAANRDIVRFGGPCLVAALRMAGPISARQHVALAQLPFAGSDQHVNAQVPHQRVAQAKVGGSLAGLDNTLNQVSDAGFLRDVTIEASHAYFDTDYFRLPSLFPGHKQRVIDAASGAIAVERFPKPLEGLQLTHIDGVRVTKTRSQDVPNTPGWKEEIESREASSHGRQAGPISVLRQPRPNQCTSFF